MADDNKANQGQPNCTLKVSMSKNHMPEMKLTIVLPMYNVRQYVAECLESIYVQPEIGQVEVILVDDGSPDDSAAIAEAWLTNKTSLRNWRIIRQQNRGLGGARNRGLAASTTPFVWFIDTDDKLSAKALSVILSYLNGSPDILSFSYVRSDGSLPVWQNEVSEPIYGLNGFEFMALKLGPMAPMKIYRREFLQQNNLKFKEHFLHEDSEFYLRSIPLAKNITVIPDRLYIYTINNNGIMRTLSVANVLDHLRHFDTYDSVIASRKYTARERALLTEELLPVISMIFRHGCKLTRHDRHLYRAELQRRKSQIIRSIKHLSLHNRVKIYIQIHFPQLALLHS